MSHLFADIYDGIRCLRILKGVSEKDILNYVQARVGNMKVGNVLKTIRTLRKLVDEGILIKKGKRYSFSGKCPKRECYETEDDNQGDECDEDDECDIEEDDAKDEQDDDDDDDDDDGCGDEEDGEDDDFDDEDDDENCNEDNQEGGENTIKEEKKMEEDATKEGKKIDSKSSFIMKPKVEENNNNNNNNNNMRNNNAADKPRDDVDTPVLEPENGRRRGNKRRRSYLEQTSDTENRGTQGAAFCARDFIDSLQPSNDEETKKVLKSQRTSQSNAESRERVEKFTPRNRGSRLKYDREPHCSYRSRSPVKGRNRDCYDTLNMDRSYGFGSSNALFQEPAEAEGDVEEKKMEAEPENADPQTNTQEGSQPKEVVKPPSMDSKYVLEVVESEVSLKESTENCIPQNRATIGTGSRRNWLEMEDKRQERTKRGLSNEDVRSYDDKAESLCSICDKKRRNS